MFNLSFWTRGTLSRLLGRGAKRISAALAIAATTLCANGQTPTPLPTVQFTSAVYSVNENAGAIRVAVSRLGDRTVPFSVSFAATDGTGQSGSDFVARTGVLNFNPGEMQKTFDVFILDKGDFSRILHDSPQFEERVKQIAKERYQATPEKV